MLPTADDLRNATYSVLRELYAAHKNVQMKLEKPLALLEASEKISPEQFHALAFLSHHLNGEATQKEIADELMVSTSKMSMLLDRMDESRDGLENGCRDEEGFRPWISRREDPIRRQARFISLTPAGQDKVRSARTFLKNQTMNWLQSMGVEKVKIIESLLYEFNQALNAGHNKNSSLNEERREAGTAATSP